MNNWTLQMMQEKNRIIKDQSERITVLERQLKKCGKERAWAERRLGESNLAIKNALDSATLGEAENILNKALERLPEPTARC